MSFDPLALQSAITALDTKVAALETQAAALASALEAKTSADVNALADKIIAALKPMVDKVTGSVDTLSLAADAGITEIVGVIRRLDGATITIKLGPESP